MNSELSNRPPRATRALVALGLVLVALVPMLPAICAGRYPSTHDSTRYDELTLLFRDAIAHGHALPRWLPDLAGGNGYPTFVFYQPLLFYVASCCGTLLPGALATMTAYPASFCFVLFGVIGAYRLARPIVESRTSALACAAFFAITPYLFVDLYVRGDHSEAAAMLCLPWPLACLMSVERRLLAWRSIVAPALAAAASLALVLLAHPAVALAFVPLLGALALARAIGMNDARRRWVIALVTVFAIAAALSSPNWFSVFQNARWVHLDRAFALLQPQDYVVAPLRLLSPRWGFDWANEPATATTAPLSAQLGLPHALLAIAGAYVGRRRPWVVATFVAYGALALSITTLATPLWRWPANPFRALQFPWRLLAICGVLQLVLIAHALAAMRPRAAWACVATTLAWSHAMFAINPAPIDFADGTRHHLGWQAVADLVRADRAALAHSGVVYATAREFDPIWSERTPAARGDQPIVATSVAMERLPGDSPYRVDVALASPTSTAAVIRQFYFPGWHVEVNGTAIDDATLRAAVTDEGLMVVPIPAGASRLVAYFDGPEFGTARTIVALAVVAAGIVALRRIDHRLTPADIPSRGTAPAP